MTTTVISVPMEAGDIFDEQPSTDVVSVEEEEDEVRMRPLREVLGKDVSFPVTLNHLKRIKKQLPPIFEEDIEDDDLGVNRFVATPGSIVRRYSDPFHFRSHHHRGKRKKRRHRRRRSSVDEEDLHNLAGSMNNAEEDRQDQNQSRCGKHSCFSWTWWKDKFLGSSKTDDKIDEQVDSVGEAVDINDVSPSAISLSTMEEGPSPTTAQMVHFNMMNVDFDDVTDLGWSSIETPIHSHNFDDFNTNHNTAEVVPLESESDSAITNMYDQITKTPSATLLSTNSNTYNGHSLLHNSNTTTKSNNLIVHEKFAVAPTSSASTMADAEFNPSALVESSEYSNSLIHEEQQSHSPPQLVTDTGSADHNLSHSLTWSTSVNDTNEELSPLTFIMPNRTSVMPPYQQSPPSHIL